MKTAENHTRSLVESFKRDGFVAVREAFGGESLRQCAAAIEKELLEGGVDPRDAATWTKPVVRINCPDGPAFKAAGGSPKLHAAYNALLGQDGWETRQGVGGTVPVRFPSAVDPGDAGWHIDGSYDVSGEWWVNIHSRGRGLLALFLFSDVGEKDAPTEIIAGSHFDVPPVLAPFGEKGVNFGPVAGNLPASTFKRPRAFATGRAGDVFICHPFLVHRATWPHLGSKPRMVAQPAIPNKEPFRLIQGPNNCPVEQTIVEALANR